MANLVLPLNQTPSNERKCSIPGCCKPHSRRGWCSMHYARWYVHGDPEKGKTPNGEIRRYLETVVFAYTGDECLIWPYQRNKNGYAVLGNKGASGIVSRLVCEFVNGPPANAKLHAAHECGNGRAGCVTGGHLSWKTSAENRADTVAHGHSIFGENAWNSKLTQEDVVEIKSLVGKVKQDDLAKRFGVTQQLISMIGRGRKWAHLG